QFNCNGTYSIDTVELSGKSISLPPIGFPDMASFQAAWEATEDAQEWPLYGLPIPIMQGNNGGNTIMKTKDGAERFLITDINNPAAGAQAQSTVAVMWDRLGVSGRSKD